MKANLNSKYFEEKDDPHRFYISEITDSEDVVIWISKNSRFRGPFNKEHGRGAQALLKRESQHLYWTHWSLPSELPLKKSLLLTWKILGLSVNTLATDENSPVLNRDNLRIPIPIQLFQKKKFFSQFLAAFLKSRLNFKHFEQKMTLMPFVCWNLRTPKTLLDKFLKRPILEDRLTSETADVPKHCWNLHQSMFILFTNHYQVN